MTFNLAILTLTIFILLVLHLGSQKLWEVGRDIGLGDIGVQHHGVNLI